ncbi:MAG: methyltransferase domain-containing protein [Acidobacteria bacterium]|nr:methyltransferase domain-containing protein [Acidobacteriota bacterium]
MTRLVDRCPLCDASPSRNASAALNLSVCPQCGLGFRTPQPTDQELELIYREAYSDEEVAAGSETMAGTTDSIATQYAGQLSRLEPLSGRRVVDYGAGLGSMSRALSQAGAAVIAVDPFSARELRKQGIDAHDTLRALPGEELYDGCTAIEVFEHLRAPWETMAEIRSVLRPGGFLLITTPNIQGLKPRLALDSWSEAVDQAHLFLFSPKSLELALDEAGYSRWKRLRGPVKFSSGGAANAARAVLQITGLDGQLRYIAWS